MVGIISSIAAYSLGPSIRLKAYSYVLRVFVGDWLQIDHDTSIPLRFVFRTLRFGTCHRHPKTS